MVSILVTGGCGLVGSNLIPRLSPKATVKVYDNLSRPSHFDMRASGCEVIVGDIRDQARLMQAASGCDVIIHLAAYGSVVESIDDPYANFEQNVLGTMRVLCAARDAKVRRLVFASTGGALIGEAPPPVHEDSLPKPISPYGASKLCGEAYCHAFAKAYGIETIALRFANVYGPWSAHKKGAVTAFAKNLIADEPIPIYGDGSATRDFVYVEDLCDGIVRASTHSLPGGEVFHIASGVETSVIELARMMARLAGKPEHPIRFFPNRAGEVTRNFAQYGKAERVLGYSPRHSLESGLAKTYAWFQGHPDLIASSSTLSDS